jgi:hypothetical protein
MTPPPAAKLLPLVPDEEAQLREVEAEITRRGIRLGVVAALRVVARHPIETA